MARYRVKEIDRRLPEKFYKEHLLHFPLVTVDLVVTSYSSSPGGTRFLLVRRSRENLAWKGVWATPGGRVFRNEKVRDAARRILLRETGLRVSSHDFIFKGYREIITMKEHGVTIVFSATVDMKNQEVRRDKSSSSVRWFAKVDTPKSLRSAYKSILSSGGVNLR